MHLLIADAGAPGALRDADRPALPVLAGWLARAARTGDAGGDPTDPHPPVERWLGRLRGHAATDALPTAAWALQAAGQAPGELAWAFVDPLHVQLDAHQALAFGPVQLALDARERALLWALLAPLFAPQEGWRTHTLPDGRWLVAHPMLANWRCASLARIELRTLDAWLPEARALRRLQNEAQMLLHASALHGEREARGVRPVNSIWLSGCGIAHRTLAPPVRLDARLREPLLAEDHAGWRQAWAALEAGPLAKLQAGDTLVLAGETWARSWQLRAPAWWQRWRTPALPPDHWERL